MRMQPKHGAVQLCESVHLGCEAGGVGEVCPINRLNPNDVRPTIIACSTVLSRGDYLFRQGDALKNLYVLHAGSLKSYFSRPKGSDHVVKFYLPGDLVGLDGLADDRHSTSVQALETISFCRIAVHPMTCCSLASPKFHWYLLKLASQEMVGEHERVEILAQRDASERLALFLLQLSQRYGKRGFSQHEFNLSMSRRDIGNFLALTAETVSRTFSHFERNGLVKVNRRRIRLLSLEGLRQVMAPRRQSLAQ